MEPRWEECELTAVRRFVAGEGQWVEDTKPTSIEQLLKVELNGRLVCEVLCSPGDRLDLAVGQLAQLGELQRAADITRLQMLEGRALVKTSSWAQARAAHREDDSRYYSLSRLRAWQGRRDIEDNVRVEAQKALQTANRLLGELAATHERTNGVHSGVIYDPAADKILVFREDIGRHNVFDKLYGWAIRHEVSLADKLVVFSGRCSTEMMLKLWRMDCRMVLAKSVPTTLSLELADKLGITLMARLTPEGFSVYTHPQRVKI
ncbi:formate dehydrogenase accessory sulfurtransferase FdhD [Selenomonas ruminantium]|uniref:FdhD protein n=1 Tax=Selenomonas ruminantium TaxID=971 RepID=A0A1I0W683_SELRU|nr:formate dehydrogenase accessory sulfurtransferase FdhD [Selenomonas ruminantium]SFA83533.1 FdhD protein [Selenomonas ruminantium]